MPNTATGRLEANFWRLWTASGLSNLADGMLKVALPLVALGLTRSPGLIAGLTVTFTLPWLLLALPAGAVADRIDRRRAMIAANLIRAALVAALAVVLLVDAGSIAAFYVVAFCLGAAETLHDTSAQALVPQIVGRDLLTRANSRMFAVEITGNQFAGPPLGSALVLLGGVATFATTSVVWLAGVTALLLMRGQFLVPRTSHTTLRADVAEGVRFVWRTRVVRRLALMVATFNLCSYAAGPLLVVYAVGPGSAMGLTPPAFGLLLASSAIGSVVGTLVAERIEARLGRLRAIVVCVLIAVPIIGIPAVTANVWVMGAVFVVCAGSLVTFNVLQISLRQRVTPDGMRGRMMSAFRMLAWGTMPLGALIGGVVAEWIGLRATFAVFGLLAFGAVTALIGLTRDDVERAEQAVVEKG